METNFITNLDSDDTRAYAELHAPSHLRRSCALYTGCMEAANPRGKFIPVARYSGEHDYISCGARDTNF